MTFVLKCQSQKDQFVQLGLMFYIKLYSYTCFFWVVPFGIQKYFINKQEPVELGDALQIGLVHRQEISSSQYDDHFCTIVLKSDFK